jgi:ADP-ribosyl-[dinitrogen reductase] hydrolase
MVATVMAGGNTDTTATIAGALLGAVHGREAVPARWRRAVLTCRPAAGLPGVHRPRPRPFWPVDLLELAESLLLAGASAWHGPLTASPHVGLINTSGEAHGNRVGNYL